MRTRVDKFWSKTEDLKRSFGNEDDFFFGIYVIDKRHNIVEIDGHPFLKDSLCDNAYEITEKWRQYQKSDARPRETPTEKPPGTSVFLPFLPIGRD